MKLPMMAGLALALATGGLAQARTPVGVWYFGGSSGTLGGYAGALMSLPGATLGHGFAVRGTGVVGEYDYRSAAGDIHGDYKGGDIALVYQSSGSWGWANVSLGPQFTQTNLSPIDPANRRRGGRWTAALQTDGELYKGVWRAGWYAQTGLSDQNYDLRAHVTHALSGEAWRLGISAAVQGDPSYRQERFGALVQSNLANGLVVELAGGARVQHALRTGGYVTLGLSKVF